MIDAAYLRISTDGQEYRSQRHALETLAARLGAPALVWYQEAEHGDDAGRSELARLLADCRAGKVRRLFVYALSRLTRGGPLHALQLVGELTRADVRIECVTDPWLSVEGPSRELLTMILSWVDRQELDRIRQRTRAGVAAARAAGVTLGRPGALDGHRRKRDEDDEAHAARRRKAARFRDGLALVAAGVTVREAARQAGCPRSTLQRLARAAQNRGAPESVPAPHDPTA